MMTTRFRDIGITPRRFAALVCWLQLVPCHALAEGNDAELPDSPPVMERRTDIRPIRRFLFTGSSLFSEKELREQVRGFIGRKRSETDPEEARRVLEDFFREQGYPETRVRLGASPPDASTVVLEILEEQPETTAENEEPESEDAGTEATAEAAGEETPTAPPETPPVAGNATAATPPAKPAPSGTDDTQLTEEDERAAEQKSAKAPAKEERFTIKGFVIEGTVLFSNEELQTVVKSFTGRNRTAADVEGARDALERFFHERGYPAMLVNIPEQSSSNRVFRLVVIENRIGNVLVSGNNHVSTRKLLREMPSVMPGSVLSLPELQKDTARVNRNPDVKVIPEMQLGKTPETVDISLKVKDSLPLHGSLEINNRATHDTTELRLSGALRYDNLWQRDHSVSFQFQLSPQDPDEVRVFSASYTAPLFRDRDDKLVLYGVVSNSNTNSALGYSNLGKGSIVGSRLIMPLQGTEGFFHTLVAGLDYKDFSESQGLVGQTGEKIPVSYLPFNVSYNAYVKDATGLTSFNAGLVLSFRGLVGNHEQFMNKRYKANANFIVLTAGMERTQRLPFGLSLLAKVDGQLSDQPLISNEQYTAGGVETVRGYRESEASGDNALHGVFELSAPERFQNIFGQRLSLTPYLFYDMALLWIRSPQEQQSIIRLHGTGIGLRGSLLKNFEFQADVAFPLYDSSRIPAGKPYVHFKVRYQF